MLRFLGHDIATSLSFVRASRAFAMGLAMLDGDRGTQVRYGVWDFPRKQRKQESKIGR